MFKTDVPATAPNRLGNALFLGLPIALLLTLLGLVLLSVLLTVSDLSDPTATFWARLLSPVAVFLASLILGARAQTKGWLSGILLGAFYAIVTYLLRTALFQVGSLDGPFLLTVLMTLAAGILGGSMGINLFGKKR